MTSMENESNVSEFTKEGNEVKSDSKENEDSTRGGNESSEKIPNGNGVAPNKMTLQLVLPHDDDGTAVHYRQRSRPVSRNGSVIESKSPGYVNTRLVNYNRGVSYQPSIRSQAHSQYHSEPEHIPPPTSQLEKTKMTKRYLATITAISYAIFLVVFGAIIFIGTAVEGRTEHTFYPASEVFCIFMLTVGFIYFIFLYTDIRMHVKKAKAAVKEREKRMQMFEEQMAQTQAHLQNSLEFTQASHNNINLQIPLPNLSAVSIQPVSHRYCFVSGRHGEFLYLKLGAAWFAFGLLIHSVLTLTYQILYLTEDSNCANVPQIIVEVMFPLYSLFVLFFIFKYCNIVINSYIGLARLMLMHAIGTSLAFWIYTIVRETQDAINMKNYKKKIEEIGNLSVRVENVDYTPELFSLNCPGPDELNTIYRNYAPYLYPFIIEFCILIVGIFYMMWANINHCPKKLSASGHSHGNNNHSHSISPYESNNFASLNSIPEEAHTPNGGVGHHSPASEVSDHCKTLVEHDTQYKSSLIVYADCHAASRGLFSGMILMIFTIVFLILLHVGVNEESYRETGILMDKIFELVVLVVLILVVVAAYFQTSKLDINLHPMSKLDDVLLFIAIPAFFSETIFSMVPAIFNGSWLNMAIILTQLTQVLIQTPWIIDALRRCANSMELRKKKPGREVVTFLTVANVSLWVYYTFSVKNADTEDERYKFYGDVIWSILNHLSLPLIMFYRFHSSVCLVDIWRHSYEPGEFAH